MYSLDMKDLEGEIWKDITDWEGFYQVSNMGRIKSMNRLTGGGRIKGRILKLSLNKQGFLYISFSKNQKSKKYLVLQLVARHFIKNVNAKRCFKYKNGDVLDNRVENIVYDDRDERLNEGYKKCSVCKNEFSLTNFYPRRNKRYSEKCKKCLKNYAIKHRNSFVEHIVNGEIVKVKNSDRIYAKHREYYRKNKARISKIDQARKKEREKTDLPYKLRRSYKTLLYNGFRQQGLFKNGRSCKDFIGCSFEDFKLHIESKFEPWMKWENYGKYGWHFGHILPCELFNLTDERQVKVCYHYSNLKPQDGVENITIQDFLDDGRRARDLTDLEKLDYLKSKGITFN